MAAKMNDPNRVTRGTCPLTPTDAVNICAGNALVKLANVNEWTCKDSNKTEVQASITVEDNGDVKLRIPFQALAPDYNEYELTRNKGHRLFYMEWALGSKHCRMVGPAGTIPLGQSRMNSLVFGYKDQADGKAVLLEKDLRPVQKFLIFPPAFEHNGKITTTPEEQRFASAVVTDEAKEKVLRFLDLVSEEVDNHPVLAAEITLLLTHRFNIQLSESHKEIVEEARNQGLDSLELELLQRQIAPRQEEKNLNVEQFDLTTEEGFALGTEGEIPAAELPEDWNASDELLNLLRASMGTSSSSSASSRVPPMPTRQPPPLPQGQDTGARLQAKPGSKVFIPPPLRK